MDNLLSIAFQAHHAEKNHHRHYAITVGRDLLDDWTVAIRYGRAGQGGRELRDASAQPDEIKAVIRDRLRRRLSAPGASAVPTASPPSCRPRLRRDGLATRRRHRPVLSRPLIRCEAYHSPAPVCLAPGTCYRKAWEENAILLRNLRPGRSRAGQSPMRRRHPSRRRPTSTLFSASSTPHGRGPSPRSTRPLIDLYWQIGEHISQRVASNGWGSEPSRPWPNTSRRASQTRGASPPATSGG